MRKTSATRRAALLVAFFLFVCADCGRTNQQPAPRDPDLVIKLSRIKSYPGQSRSNVDTGMYMIAATGTRGLAIGVITAPTLVGRSLALLRSLEGVVSMP